MKTKRGSRSWLLRGALGVGAASALVAGCRDAAEPFRPVDRVEGDDASLVRLTHSSGDDRTPTWSHDGDTIYFTASRYDGNPLAPATVLALPANGLGSVRPLLINVQVGTGRGTAVRAPAISLDGERVAFVRVLPLLPEGPCVGQRVCPTLENLPMVRLTRAEIHARAIDATSGLADDVVLPLRFEGHGLIADPDAPGGTITISEFHPFQYQFEAEGRSFFRPSWSPDGTRLVVSDGLLLRRWTLGAANDAAIPGTGDGLMPAWSPDGEWIAYARYERTSSQTFTCEYQNVYPNPPNPPVVVTDCIEQRTIHATAAPQIVLIRPDGSESRVLGEGTDPAWSPDGQFVYASAEADGGPMIVRMSIDGSPAAAVPLTRGGIEPAVSPDGRRLAFVRPAAYGAFPPERPTPGAIGISHDVWVVDLP